MKLNLQESVTEFILEKGFDDKYGARPIRRAVQTHIEDMLAEEIIKGTMKQGDTVTLSIKDGKPVVRVRSPKEK